MARHAKLSPSSAERWMVCTAAPGKEAEYPQSSNEAADEGTAAHLLASTVLEHRVEGKPAECSDFTGQKIWVPDPEDVGFNEAFISLSNEPSTGRVFTVDEDMAGYVQTYIDQIMIEGYDEIYVEVRVPIGEITGEFNDDGSPATGTVDCAGVRYVDDGIELHIHDLKYGKHEVGVVDNKQLMLYALGAIELYEWMGDITQVTLNIHQPRLHAAPGVCMTVEGLKAFGAEVSEVCDKIHAGDVVFVPGDKQCFFCNHKPDCKAMRDMVVDTVTKEFPLITTKGPRGGLKTSVPADMNLNEAMKHAAMVISWGEAVKEAARGRLEDDRESMPDWKLTKGRGARVYLDDEAFISYMEEVGIDDDEFRPRILLTVPKLEKQLGKKMFKQIAGNHVKSVDGNPVVKPLTDKAAEIVMDVKSEFEDLDK